ncbi:MAG: glutathione S-transferase N-terminal domain-containing protein [Candidatus Vogelbacteria bacterium]|nr:glutathione S-transferase N-terminal domain-containing protein [Candidatus Vogelbacteria bacterium]
MNNKKVVIYTTPSCVYCRAAKALFHEKGIKYEEYNVGLDATRREEMIDKSGQMGVPVITIADEDNEEQVIVGFDKATLTAALGL